MDLSTYQISGFDTALVDGDASYAKSYSKDSNEGYEKTITQDGGFTFTAFTRTGGHDAFHPDYFCFADYAGADSGDLSLFGNFELMDTLTQESFSGVGYGGASGFEPFLIIGNLNEQESLKLTLSLLDSQGEQAFWDADEKARQDDHGSAPLAADYGLTSGSAVITVHHQ